MHYLTTPIAICDFGLHKGQPYRKLPVSFLNWMVMNKHQHASLAQQELDRRRQAALTR
ncbi:hypothetical protein [Pseudoalteromonas tunicata]|jgi:hypothetical protein|uniref:Putative orphan protein n=1 Tax=Pseudoalteromonas tunicata D2 TaxID=87626 RepID=A4C4U6_9GAMM|nr:hypothetical protein [Pseudoalteromonas tunicata]ATC96943.1 hypothetical protein PTUN_b0581 [Pseudoalteromonas tunicata]EAR30578.1 putative orphan protein [Pseudoalteromonas tunicata D2]MDP4983947.1 hypothetical protein [Pseudoalteromonas tunicata]MDP5213934.1 hypothetical protein [Pseudoalteromonas tunicata]